jgi:hypothetical protein
VVALHCKHELALCLLRLEFIFLDGFETSLKFLSTSTTAYSIDIWNNHYMYPQGFAMTSPAPRIASS